MGDLFGSVDYNEDISQLVENRLILNRERFGT